MRISPLYIQKLQELLKDQYGLELSVEDAQQAGLAIMRFYLTKGMRTKELGRKKPIDVRRYGV